MMNKIIISLIAFLFCNVIFGQGTQLLRQPSLSATNIVFVYANDLWQVERTGGKAIRLTTNEGYESNPHYSDDGKWIAFSGQYDGNTDVYIVSSEGGSPARLTWHPGQDIVQGWTPEGEVLFRSSRHAHPSKSSSFYTIGTDGGLPTALPVKRSAYGEISADGKYLAYAPIVAWDAEWRNYRGGQAMPIWIQNLQTGDLVRTPQTDKERHMDPVWVNDKVYYLSERDFASNIWSYDMASKKETQITNHKVFDVKSLDAFGGDMIYEQGGYLHLLAAGNTSATQLDIQVSGDMNFSRPRWENVSAGQLSNANVSPNGKRAIFESRGEIITVPKKDGSPRNLTNSSGAADRTPIWSPEGDKVAYFSDRSGEYQMIIADQKGAIQKTIDMPAGTFYYRPDWSPDGKYIAFTDTDYNIWITNITTGNSKKVDTDEYAHPNRTFNPVWSPDSRYIAYVKQQASHFKSVFLYDTKLSKKEQITEGLADIVTPVFDQSGKYLYYLVSTNYGLSSGWLDMSSYDPSVTRSLYLTVLHNDGNSPLSPKSDEEKKEEDDKEKDQAETMKAIDVNQIQYRTVAISKVQGEYIGLERGPENHVMILESSEDGVVVHNYNASDDKLEEYTGGVNYWSSSYNGEHAVYSKSGSWFISSLAGVASPEDDRLDIDIKIKINPTQEYKQIFKEGWRFMRDYLYVDNVHGAPWQQVWDWYAPWIDHVRHRTDLNYVVDIMSGEVAVGHSFVRGGDMPDIDRVGIGLLGADYVNENGLYKISKIYSGETWNPDVRAPLYMPGLDVKEGDYITSVNGKKVEGSENIYAYFEETAGKQIQLSIKRDSAGKTHEVTVVPVANESGLRNIGWMEDNRRKVAELSDNKLAYVYVPNTSGVGFTNFNRYYFSQQDKKGVIIDERNNGGGSAADYMIDVMSREPIGYFNSKTEHNRPWTAPISGIWGPKVMIINERAGSGGDLLPYMFKLKKLGPLVGTRTWGGLVGTWDTPLFVDGGRMVAPRGGFFDLDGEWSVEGEGVSPDIEVIQDPKITMEGRDPQLEAAVEEALRLLESEEYELKPEPEAPVRWKRPAGWNKDQ
jgi:tricorn protease